MSIKARYAHTNIVSRDFRSLAEFYVHVFGCVPIDPLRDLSGSFLDDATGLSGAHIRGVHLELPGFQGHAPTLEIFQYDVRIESESRAVNRVGLAHLAFAVEDVAAAVSAVLDAGGGQVGEVVSTTLPGAGEITFVYVSDPEGNIIELQHWDD